MGGSSLKGSNAPVCGEVATVVGVWQLYLSQPGGQLGASAGGQLHHAFCVDEEQLSPSASLGCAWATWLKLVRTVGANLDEGVVEAGRSSGFAHEVSVCGFLRSRLHTRLRSVSQIKTALDAFSSRANDFWMPQPV